jgi:putative N6-adenine-specific DNA methylase
MEYRLIATTVFGMEAITAYEIKALGYENVVVENGRVLFDADERGLVRANLWLRTAERIFVLIREFKATTFESLFNHIVEYRWEKWLPEDATFPVNAKSINSKLFSLSDIQRIGKKAISKRMTSVYQNEWHDETGPTFDIHINILKDMVTVAIDTSGTGLHKRGYRERANQAPMKETLAAGLVNIARWQPKIPLIDPMCGSGTIAIEAAMIARRIAPGLKRKFSSELWPCIDASLWQEERDKAYKEIITDVDVSICGYDIDPRTVEIAKENAKLAGVDDIVHFEVRPVQKFLTKENYGYIICNPPYGDRLEDKVSIDKLYREMGAVFSDYPTWSKYIITSYEAFESAYGSKASKNRKLYNGRIKTYFYQYYGEKPPRRGTVS